MAGLAKMSVLPGLGLKLLAVLATAGQGIAW
jgi:hypothetical protein